MKKFAVGCLSVCIAAFCIALVALGVFKFLGKTLPYQSYPRTEARIVKVETRAVHPGADPVEYESSVQLEYTVDGQSVRGHYTFSRDTNLKEGDTVSVAYNPDNPSDCAVMGGPDPMTLLAFGVAVAVIASMCWSTFRRK